MLAIWLWKRSVERSTEDENALNSRVFFTFSEYISGLGVGIGTGAGFAVCTCAEGAGAGGIAASSPTETVIWWME